MKLLTHRLVHIIHGIILQTLTHTSMILHRCCCTAFVISKNKASHRILPNIPPTSTISSNRRIISNTNFNYPIHPSASKESIEDKHDDVTSVNDSSVVNKYDVFVKENDELLEGQQQPQPQQQRRRIRYNGKYPKNFNEKYKELNGDVVTIQKVLEKGRTPAGQHIPIMIQECMYYLGFTNEMDGIETTHNDATTTSCSLDKKITFVDCTLGYGGHSTHVLKYILERLNGTSNNRPEHDQIICFDRDPIEIVKATERLYNVVTNQSSNLIVTTSSSSELPLLPQDFVTTVNRNFGELRTYLQETNQLGTITALLADLGISSMQIDDATRGFTYKQNGPLDMRMTNDDTNNRRPSESSIQNDANRETAYDLLCRLTIKEFTKILEENSDEVYASHIAQAVLGRGKQNIPTTTLELSNTVREVVRPLLSMKNTKPPHQQQQLSKKQSLPQVSKTNIAGSSLKKQPDSAATKKILDSTIARVMQAIRIEVNHEFESLEQLLHDLPYIMAPGGRIVFLTFHSGEDRRVKKALKTGYNAGIYTQWSRDVVRPSSTERYNNSRSTCCKLRWAIRSDKPI